MTKVFSAAFKFSCEPKGQEGIRKGGALDSLQIKSQCHCVIGSHRVYWNLGFNFHLICLQSWYPVVNIFFITVYSTLSIIVLEIKSNTGPDTKAQSPFTPWPYPLALPLRLAHSEIFQTLTSNGELPRMPWDAGRETHNFSIFSINKDLNYDNDVISQFNISSMYVGKPTSWLVHGSILMVCRVVIVSPTLTPL